MTSAPDVIIVGAGLAGLCCARRLAQCNIPFEILEASDGVGGRVRTDIVDGFRLDRGFQIFLPAYPEARRVLDYEPLNLRPFARGAIIRFQGRGYRMVDPRAEFTTSALSLFAPIGTIADKFRLARLKWTVDHSPIEGENLGEDQPTLDYLRWAGGFSENMINRLFRPFFGGVFLEPQLLTSSRFFRFVFRMMSEGFGTIPQDGIQRIPEQIAQYLPAGSIRLNSKVVRIDHDEVALASGETRRARAIVLAVEGPAAVELSAGAIPPVSSNSSVSLYFSADRSPTEGEAIPVLNGDGSTPERPVNLAVCLSDASRSYAPPGKSLMVTQIVGDDTSNDLESRVRRQLQGWFGPEVDRWQFLRSYRIPHSLPELSAGKLTPWQRPVRMRPGFYICGDHRDQASMNGAMTSGFRTAQAVAEDLDEKRI